MKLKLLTTCALSNWQHGRKQPYSKQIIQPNAFKKIIPCINFLNIKNNKKIKKQIVLQRKLMTVALPLKKEKAVGYFINEW